MLTPSNFVVLEQCLDHFAQMFLARNVGLFGNSSAEPMLATFREIAGDGVGSEDCQRVLTGGGKGGSLRCCR